MKKILLFLYVVFVLGVMNSCIYEKVIEYNESTDEPPIIQPPVGATKKTFYYRFLPDSALDSAAINTYAGPSLGGVSPSLYWSDSESVGVFMSGSNGDLLFRNRECEFIPSESTIYVDTLTTNVETATVYGYTPYQSSISGTIVRNVTLDNIQNQSADKSTERYMDESLEKNVFTISTPSNAFALDGGMAPITFKSVFAFMRIRVTRSSSYTTFLRQRIKSVKLYIANEDNEETPLDYALAGNYDIDVSKAPGTSGYEGPEFTSRINNITASVTGGDHISEFVTSPYVWFVINPTPPLKPAERLIVKVETGAGVDVDYTIISRHEIPALEANKIYTLNVEANEITAIPDNDTPDSNHFSDSKPSNCYIIPQAGWCRIPLRTIDAAPLRGDTVEWLWASKERGGSNVDMKTLIDPSTIVYDESKGEVRFRVGTEYRRSTKGNVILALKKANKIVWTWHIWITDKPQNLKYENGKTFLDRNIGALSANMVPTEIDNYGFVYQWGRKDPFIGGDGEENETNVSVMPAAVRNTMRNTGAVWSVNPVATVDSYERTIENPMQFVCSSSLLELQPSGWLSSLPDDPALWSETRKTNYDPCPYGYKVPSRDDIGLHIDTPNDFWPWYFRNDGDKSWKYCYENVVSVWPSAGMRQGRVSFGSNVGGQLIYSGTDKGDKGQCFYWTSSPVTIIPVSGASHRIHTTSNNILNSKDDFGDNADAYSVRCVRDPAVADVDIP